MTRFSRGAERALAAMRRAEQADLALLPRTWRVAYMLLGPRLTAYVIYRHRYRSRR